MAVDARATLIRAKTAGADTLVDAVLTTNSPEAKLYDEAVKLRRSPIKKSYVEACLLASTDYERISSLIGVRVELLLLYHDVFFDVKGLDKLSKLDLVQQADSPDENMMKLWALNQGLDFIAWRLGDSVQISPTDGLQSLFATCVMKSKEAMFSGNAAAGSIEATKWVKLSVDIARLLRNWVMDNDGARGDLEMALRESNPDFGSFAGLDKLDQE